MIRTCHTDPGTFVPYSIIEKKKLETKASEFKSEQIDKQVKLLRKESNERATRSKWLGLFSPSKERGDGKGPRVRRAIRRSFESKRNGGRKPRNTKREQIRQLRELPEEIRLLVGEQLAA